MNWPCKQEALGCRLSPLQPDHRTVRHLYLRGILFGVIGSKHHNSYYMEPPNTVLNLVTK